MWTGQILNGFAVTFLALLAMRIHHSPWSGVFALLIGGLLVPMPMYYVNWGRYTQLAGQAILPAAIYLAWVTLDAKTTDRRLVALSWLAWGGLALAHYRVLIFGALFFPAYFILFARRAGLRRLIARTFWMGLGAGLLFLPWFIHAYAGQFLTIFARQMTRPPSQLSDYVRQANSIGDIFAFLPAIVWLSLPVLTGWGLFRRNWGVALVSLWWFLVFLAANPGWLNLPGTLTLSNFAVFIAAYFPASIIIGGMAGWLLGRIQRPLKSSGSSNDLTKSPISPWVYAILLSVIALSIGLWGTQKRLQDTKPALHALVTRPDLHAAAWLDENTPKNAHLLINSFFAFNDLAIVGADGGWWLPLLAGRKITVPPLNYISEQGPFPNYSQWVNHLIRQIIDKGIDDPETIEMLQERRITHIYVGQRQGTINSPGPLLSLEQLLASPHFNLVYQQDRVWIFEFSP
jgi:hypothetical protein